ncbi:MAG: U32 family peptidase [Myxococcales bacterium]|nr:U32 family peptidase [Myxococcales bacterium]MCB9532132.1 U32 family peptidase [Myxococcales bacterium]
MRTLPRNARNIVAARRRARAVCVPVRTVTPTLAPRVLRRPEVLAPAGDWTTLRAALAAGADAVYFGLDEGFNARARAHNFSVDELDAVAEATHRAGARAFLTMNTLVFESELDAVESLVRAAAAAGIDALIVQDFAVAAIARAVCPALALHASTQMTISSREGLRLASDLGIQRVVLPRELSVSEVADLAADSPVELEVFIHGALCMSWSGQCLTSEAWGGRSANRGQCAQSCRLPYELVVDGETHPLGDVRYLLSPLDLAGVHAVPALMEAGVHSLKIEGRLKGAAYATEAVTLLKHWIDAVAAGTAATPGAADVLAADLGRSAVTYSRGFSDGFLAGADHQALVDGRSPKHRGILLGEVTNVDSRGVDVARARPSPRMRAVGGVASPLPRPTGSRGETSSPEPEPPALRAGLGVAFDTGHPELSEPGGPIFDVQETRDGWRLRFGTPGPDLGRVRAGHRVWLTGDPAVTQHGQDLSAATPEGRIPVSLNVTGTAGAPLRVTATTTGTTVTCSGEAPLVVATGGGLDEALLRGKLGALGGTPFRLADLDLSRLAPNLHVPVSSLKAVRRELVTLLESSLTQPRTLHESPVVPLLRPVPQRQPAGRPELVVLCRTMEQLDAVIAAGLSHVELDWMELVGLEKAVHRARAAGLDVTLATVRVQKPGEEGFDRRLARLSPTGVLVRHWGALMSFAELQPGERPSLHGDFSLNVTNSVAAAAVLSRGLDTLTASHDLDLPQLLALLAAVDPGRVTVVVHHHISTFHTEHCVYAARLSRGRDYRTCGRPCEAHRVALRDTRGQEHPVVVDVGCRNTVFNAQAQSAAGSVPALLAAGVRRFRVEFVWEDAATAAAVVRAYRDLLDGTLTPPQCVAAVGAHEQFGVTAGTMQVLAPRLGATAARHRPRLD